MAKAPDFQQFQNRLLKASETTFVTLTQDHPDERFYAFGLFHESLWAYVYPTANSEEGLLRRAEEYKLDPRNMGYTQMSLESLALQLRWNPADWIYHTVGEDSFQPVNDWLTQNNIYWLYDDDDELRTGLHEQMISICRDVLRTLDTAKTFGAGNARENVVLNIMMGDQDASWFAHARALNAPSVYDRWISEVKLARLL